MNGFTDKFKEGYQSISDISIEVSEQVQGIWATPSTSPAGKINGTE